MNSKIKELQEQIAIEQRKISNCKHVFGDSYYNPYTVSEPYGSRLVGQGSDAWFEAVGHTEVSKPRWSRTCTKCGSVQHTETQEPIITGYKPKF